MKHPQHALRARLALLTVVAAVPTALRAGDLPRSGSIVEHTLTIVHPGDPDAVPLEHVLMQHRDETDQPSGYSMWVDSVICREETCDVVKVRLHWDPLGRYQRYEVAEGSRLTKLDHKPFTKADLAKLQLILSDPESPLREVEKEAMTGEMQKRSENAALDGVSGATILSLKHAVIIGAGYTCYDLWQWANSLMPDRIRALTAQDASVKSLLAYLAQDDVVAAKFAVTSLQQRGIGEASEAVIACALRGDAELTAAVMAYLEATADSGAAYRERLLKLFRAAKSPQRVVVLETLLEEDPGSAPAFYAELCETLPLLETFYEVQLCFKLCERQEVTADLLVDKAGALLKHEKFFVQRRAFEYLNGQQSLPGGIAKCVDEFYAKHRDRL